MQNPKTNPIFRFIASFPITFCCLLYHFIAFLLRKFQFIKKILPCEDACHNSAQYLENRFLWHLQINYFTFFWLNFPNRMVYIINQCDLLQYFQVLFFSARQMYPNCRCIISEVKSSLMTFDKYREEYR